MAAAAQGFDVPGTAQQGATIRLETPDTIEAARFNGRRIRIFPQSDHRALGLMPVPVDTKPGTYVLELLDKDGTVASARRLRIVNAQLPSQNVVLRPELTRLKPSPGETEMTEAFRTAVSSRRYWSDPLVPPVAGCMTSLFGVRRLHNGKPTGAFHGGVDLRSSAGAPVYAAAAGVVKIVRPFNLHGGTVAIDHGQGLETMYLHLSGFATQEGATVKSGDVIGYVGSTGRSTAPHLHWTIYVNGVAVNPGQWVALHACTVAKRPRRGKR